ncbi:MAG: cytochrome c [Candidatus Binatia bacterium]|nr:cytochrome c [Candidatus Binatia bacterium]
MRRLFAYSIVTLAPLLLLGGCRQDMHDQPRYEPNSASAFFPNGTSVRPLVEGVVARGTVLDDPARTTGKVDEEPVMRNPIPVDEKLLERGRERYGIYCTPCHGAIGDGNGMIVQRGYRRPPSLHQERIIASPDGYLFDVITNGYGVMPAYRAQVPVDDRWAIVAYMRALQLSQTAELERLPPVDRRALLASGGEP